MAARRVKSSLLQRNGGRPQAAATRFIRTAVEPRYRASMIRLTLS